MANRFATMAMNAPDNCNVSMRFEYWEDLSISEFLERINIPYLFHNVVYWQAARFTFRVRGVDYDCRHAESTLKIDSDFTNCTLRDVAPRILQEYCTYACNCPPGFRTLPKVLRMEVFFRR